MIIVIDAYNMIKQALRQKEISAVQRTEFVAQLHRYANRKKHQLIVVFDGGPYQWVHKERKGDLQIIYSGAHASADEYIMQYLYEHRYADILLVSDDHELVLHASDLMLPSIAALGFDQLVREALMNNKKQISESQPLLQSDAVDSEDIDCLMERASRHVLIKQTDQPVGRAIQSTAARRGSKIERKLLQILKKL
jgi:predicted RNA-binding protein with PIN domain